MANAPVPSPRNFNVAEFETAAYLNSLRDALNFLLNPPMAVVYQNTVQSIPNNAFTPVTFDLSLTDTYSGHSNSTNNSRYTGQVPGWYDLDGAFSLAANGTGVRDGAWAKNGAAITTPGAGTTVAGNAGWTATQAMPGLQVFLNGAGDYVELWVIQTAGAALNTNIATFTSYASIRLAHV